MFKKIKEYFEIRKLYRDSKKVLVINGAATITSVKNIVDKVESFVNSMGEVSEISKEDLTTMTSFMSQMLNNKDIQKQAVTEIINKMHTKE